MAGLRWLAVLVSLLLMGCPFSSAVPLDTPNNGVVEPKILGTWTAEDPEKKQGTELEFTRFNEHEYLIVMRSTGAGPHRTDYLRAFSTPVGARTLVNLQLLDHNETKNSYLFGAYEFSGDNTLKVVLAKEDAFKQASGIDTPTRLRSYVEAHMSEKGFFEAFPTFHRKATREKKAD